MKLYIAGLHTSTFHKQSQGYARLTPKEREARDSIENLLESYHYVHKDIIVGRMRDDGDKIFLDSGAFSAFTKGIKVDLREYCDYIKKNSDLIRYDDGVMLASVLDGIGDPLLTWQNQQAMESLGVRPLPCFHYGEDERYLEWYISHYDYITLGGMVPISTPQLFIWLDRIWDRYLTDGAGRPRIKVHGFGLTAVPLMERYPWYSVDSSTWVQIAFNGGIMLPGVGVVSVSERSPLVKIADRHLDTMPPMLAQEVRRQVAALGFDIERFRVEYPSRWAFNCWAFEKLSQNLSARSEIFSTGQPELF